MYMAFIHASDDDYNALNRLAQQCRRPNLSQFKRYHTQSGVSVQEFLSAGTVRHWLSAREG